MSVEIKDVDEGLGNLIMMRGVLTTTDFVGRKTAEYPTGRRRIKMKRPAWTSLTDVLDFWFHQLEPDMWWTKSDELDSTIRERFGPLHHQAAQCELSDWRGTAEGALAEILVLDQFSRNLYRGTPQSFASDPLALALAQSAISKGFHRELSKVEAGFLYLPFMHSESPVIHEHAVRLYTELGNPKNLDFELKHKAIIDRFGRYPHRNDILGRISTAEEIEFLKQPDSSF